VQEDYAQFQKFFEGKNLKNNSEVIFMASLAGDLEILMLDVGKEGEEVWEG
jgi:hypothetical protein